MKSIIRFYNLHELIKVTVLLPVRDVVEIFKPFIPLVGDERIVHRIAKSLTSQVVFRKGFYGFSESPRQILDALFIKHFLRLEVHVLAVGRSGIEFLFDAFQSSRQYESANEIRIVLRIGKAKLETAGSGNAYGIGAIVVSVVDIERRPGKSAHRALLDQAFVAIDRGTRDCSNGWQVSQKSSTEVISELRESETVWILLVLESVFFCHKVVQTDVEVSARSRAI